MPESDPREEGPRSSVLVVDDEVLILSTTRKVLESAGFDVTTAQSGQAAVDSALREAPDVILLDIMMPAMDGWETLRRLRAEPRTASIPVIVFTAREHVRGGRLARDLGAVDYVPKPFQLDDLVARVRAHASRAAAPLE